VNFRLRSDVPPARTTRNPAMAPTIARQSETSPLLPKPGQDAHPIGSGVGIAPEGADAGDGGDIERQTSHGDAFKHQGMPEVKKRMKYIFPAICIGVSKQSHTNHMKKLTVNRSSSQQRTKPSS
jgi:hypothetical protein